MNVIRLPAVILTFDGSDGYDQTRAARARSAPRAAGSRSTRSSARRTSDPDLRYTAVGQARRAQHNRPQARAGDAMPSLSKRKLRKRAC